MCARLFLCMQHPRDWYLCQNFRYCRPASRTKRLCGESELGEPDRAKGACEQAYRNQAGTFSRLVRYKIVPRALTAKSAKGPRRRRRPNAPAQGVLTSACLICAHEGRRLMPRTASVLAAREDEETTTHVDELIQRGRGQGFLSLPELRDAFDQARVSPTEARSIIRELTEAGVVLGNEPADHAEAAGNGPATVKAAAGLDAELAEAEADLAHLADAGATEALAEDASASVPESDLDDQTSVMGDSVHTYLKSIGRRQLLTAEEEVELAKRIEAGLFAEYKLETERRLSKQLRADLEAVAEDGRRAKAHMLEANLRLVVSVAKKYSDRGLSLLDVVQEGNLGLIRAVEKFDYTKGYKFSTYAMWWIRQAIQRGFADSARTIRL